MFYDRPVTDLGLNPFWDWFLNEYADAVIDRKSCTRYRDVIRGLDLGGIPVYLDEGFTIRPIDEEELWELGGATIPTAPFSLQLSPVDNWCMLDIVHSHQHDAAAQIATTLYNFREAVVANLTLAVDGGFTLLPIGMTTNFGPNATGTTTHGSRMPREFGRFPGIATVVINDEVRQRLEEMWPRVKEIMQSPAHYLNLPLRRLVDGLGRTRLDEKIVDYAIGLESLLTESARDELSYRLSLRGATVLEDVGENRAQAFEEFKAFYNARSTIVHGGPVSKLNLHALAASGERLLRRIWIWYYDQGLATLKGTTARIDLRMLMSGQPDTK